MHMYNNNNFKKKISRVWGGMGVPEELERGEGTNDIISLMYEILLIKKVTR